MKKAAFKKLLVLNQELSNQLQTMTDQEKASIKGGLVFRKVHQTDLKIAKAVIDNPKFNEVVERGEY